MAYNDVTELANAIFKSLDQNVLKDKFGNDFSMNDLEDSIRGTLSAGKINELNLNNNFVTEIVADYLGLIQNETDLTAEDHLETLKGVIKEQLNNKIVEVAKTQEVSAAEENKTAEKAIAEDQHLTSEEFKQVVKSFKPNQDGKLSSKMRAKRNISFGMQALNRDYEDNNKGNPLPFTKDQLNAFMQAALDDETINQPGLHGDAHKNTDEQNYAIFLLYDKLKKEKGIDVRINPEREAEKKLSDVMDDVIAVSEITDAIHKPEPEKVKDGPAAMTAKKGLDNIVNSLAVQMFKGELVLAPQSDIKAAIKDALEKTYSGYDLNAIELSVKEQSTILELVKDEIVDNAPSKSDAIKAIVTKVSVKGLKDKIENNQEPPKEVLTAIPEKAGSLQEEKEESIALRLAKKLEKAGIDSKVKASVYEDMIAKKLAELQKDKENSLEVSDAQLEVVVKNIAEKAKAAKEGEARDDAIVNALDANLKDLVEGKIEEKKPEYITGIDNIVAAVSSATITKFATITAGKDSKLTEDEVKKRFEKNKAKVEKALKKYLEGQGTSYLTDVESKLELKDGAELAISSDGVDNLANNIAGQLKDLKLRRQLEKDKGKDLRLEDIRNIKLDEHIKANLFIKEPAKDEKSKDKHSKLSKDQITKIETGTLEKIKADNPAGDKTEEKVKEKRKKAQKEASQGKGMGMTGNILTSIGAVAALVVAWKSFKAAFVGREATEADVEAGRAEAEGDRIRPPMLKTIGMGLVAVVTAAAGASFAVDAFSKEKKFGDTGKSWVDKVTFGKTNLSGQIQR
jgi:hypothetical protein